MWASIHATAHAQSTYVQRSILQELNKNPLGECCTPSSQLPQEQYAQIPDIDESPGK